MRHVDALQRRCRLGEGRIDPPANGVDALPGDSAKLDRLDADERISLRQGANEPTRTRLAIEQRRLMPIAAAVEYVDDGALNCQGHVGPLWRCLRRRMPRAGSKERNAATGDGADMVLNCGVDVGRARRHSETAREKIESLHLLLALPRGLDVLAHAVGELTGHDSDDHEEDEIRDMRGLGNANVVDRRIKEECRCRQAGQPRDDRRRDAPTGRSNDDGDQVAEGGVVQIEQRAGHE